MSDGSEKRPLTKMLWSVSIKTRTYASVNTCNGSFYSCLKLLKQYRTIEQICSDAHSITLNYLFYKHYETTYANNARWHRCLRSLVLVWEESGVPGGNPPV